MKKTNTKILEIDFSLERKTEKLPINIYALKVHNADDDSFFELAIEHEGFCPDISSSYQESRFSEYLCNLEYSLIDDYFKSIKAIKPKSYYSVCEVITNNKGELFKYSKLAD